VTDDKIALVTCTDTTLAAGAHTTCTGTYTTDQGDVDHGSVTNNASVTGNPAAGNLAPATDSLTIDAAGPALTLKKSADATTYDANQLITYSYLVTNTGNVTITDLAVTDDKIALVTCTDTTSRLVRTRPAPGPTRPIRAMWTMARSPITPASPELRLPAISPRPPTR